MAIEQQKKLAQKIHLIDKQPSPRYIAGIDVGFEQKGQITRAAVALLSFPELSLIDFAVARRPTQFPYIPGLLSFRELPAILDAMNLLALLPDLLMIDGHGIAHPRRFGLACHIALITSLPSIGVGKSRLIGTHELISDKNTNQNLIHHGEIIGKVIQSRIKARPIYISPGNNISLDHSVELVLASLKGYRLPEPIRWAHRIASDPKNKLLRALSQEKNLIERVRNHVERQNPDEIC
ncbi:MAG: deoxyribonuclease V [Proteobacteria bacterium]|nr:deoxyribonuclease V [Pseudomonadota bacterium]